MKPIETISIVGTGNVAYHLGRAIFQSGITIRDIYGRDQEKARSYAKTFNSISIGNIEDLTGDLIFLCVNDDAVSDVSKLISKERSIVHTSGALEMELLSDHAQFGAFYPLQTFSTGRNPDFTGIPLLIEGNSPEFTLELIKIAERISKNVISINGRERKKIHLSAVFINNFTNHIVLKAKSILDKENIDWKILMPLLKETVSKLEQMDPYDAQTGPARRGDKQTIDNHIDMLAGKEKEIYQLMTNSIIESYRNQK